MLNVLFLALVSGIMYSAGEVKVIQEVTFKGKIFKLILTNHATERMKERKISKNLVIEILETGKALEKQKKNKWWVYKKIKSRNDNYVCLSITIESPQLIVITTLINWRPKT